MMTPIDVYRGVRALVRITADPTRLDEVFVLADLAEHSPEIGKLVEGIKADPRFARVLIDRPRLGRIDLDELVKLPEGTLGRTYADFMRARGLSPESLVLVDGQSELDYVRNHMRETHDLWHVATGFDTDVAGELGLQAFYLAQFKGPLPVMLIAVGMLNTLFRAMDDADRRLHAIARGYLLGRRGRSLFGLKWAARWNDRIEDLRRDRNLDLEAVDRILAVQGPESALLAAA